MHDTSDKYLLQIEPKNTITDRPVYDDITEAMELFLKGAREGPAYRGFHCCTGCGKASGNKDLYVGSYVTNSLASHYLKWHRDEVPNSEIDKLKELMSGADNMLYVKVSDKYAIVQRGDGRVEALRYGEPWRECTGDSLLLEMAYLIDELRGKGNEG